MEKNITKNEKKKINFIQYLRIVACIAVIAIHVSDDRLRESIGLDWWFMNLFDSISRWGVPIFFMIIGCTLLSKEISIKKLYKKYIFRICYIYCAWSALYTLIYADYNNTSILNLIESFIKGYYHLWFLYALIGIYMCIPFFRKLIEDKKTIEYFIFLWFVIGSIFFSLGEIDSLKNVYAVLQERLSLFFVLGYSGYCILGYYIYKYNLSYKGRMCIYFLGLLGGIITILYAQINKGNYSFIYENMLPSVIFMSAAIFTYFRNSKVLNAEHKFLLKISELTLGIYLIHPIIFKMIKKFGIYSTSINTIIMIPILVVLIFVISLLIIMVLKKIKILKKII